MSVGTENPWARFAAPAPAGPERRPGRTGVVAVWRLELAKCARLVRVQVVLLGCLLGPFLVAGALAVQSAVPSDTLFGQWLHESGFALPMVLLSFVGQWVLPLLTAVVAGDIFSAEDHFGTWKTILTRSCSRAEVFAGKALAALTWTVAVFGLLAAAAIAAGALLGTEPVVGLTGQLVPSGQAFGLVVASWATCLPPLLGFCALAGLLSVLARTSVVGMGGPVVLGLVMQLATLVDLPAGVRDALLATPFAAWHGLWAQPAFTGPVWTGLLVSAIWFVVAGAASWLVFRRRGVRVS